jgi:predicted alpha/beta hydrolase
MLQQESLMVPVTGSAQLHLRRIWSEGTTGALPVLMLHGAAEDGHIFYSHQGRGLACYLARNGCEVFVPDLRGKGKSWPGINQHSEFGFHALITIDLPALAATVGGALAVAAVARAGASALGVNQLVHFGARRQVNASGWRRRLLVDWMWNRVGSMAVAWEGFLPANRLGLGTARESAQCFHDAIAWSRGDAWLDPEDEFDYAAAVRRDGWLRSLYFAASNDRAFGAPEDVRDFMHELGRHDGRLLVLGRAEGNLHDYGHTGMLLHPDAEQDHFPQLLGWLGES